MVQMLVVMVVVVVVMTGLTGKHGMTWAWLDGCGARRLGGRGPKKRGGQGSWAGPAGAQRRSPTPLFDKARLKPKSGGSGWWTGLAETRPDMGQRAASAAAAACAGTGSEVCVCVCARACRRVCGRRARGWAVPGSSPYPSLHPSCMLAQPFVACRFVRGYSHMYGQRRRTSFFVFDTLPCPPAGQRDPDPTPRRRASARWMEYLQDSVPPL